MLLATGIGIDWSSFPTEGASVPDQVSAQQEICATVTSTLDSMANQTLRATVDVEQEFGPDFIITILPNGWARFRLSHWPILQLVSAQYCVSGGAAPVTWTPIPANALMMEHSGLPVTGTIVPSGPGPNPTAALIGPGYINWYNGRKGWLLQVTSINGFPVAGIDEATIVGATSVHVDDIGGWWNGTAGARGIIFDPPWRESATCAGSTPDVTGAINGPGTLTLANPLQFPHRPSVGLDNTPSQKILLSAMPHGIIQAGYYLATHYGLIRGATAAVMQSSRGQVITSGMRGAMDWYGLAEKAMEPYARAVI